MNHLSRRDLLKTSLVAVLVPISANTIQRSPPVLSEFVVEEVKLQYA